MSKTYCINVSVSLHAYSFSSIKFKKMVMTIILYNSTITSNDHGDIVGTVPDFLKNLLIVLQTDYSTHNQMAMEQYENHVQHCSAIPCHGTASSSKDATY